MSTRHQHKSSPIETETTFLLRKKGGNRKNIRHRQWEKNRGLLARFQQLLSSQTLPYIYTHTHTPTSHVYTACVWETRSATAAYIHTWWGERGEREKHWKMPRKKKRKHTRALKMEAEYDGNLPLWVRVEVSQIFTESSVLSSPSKHSQFQWNAAENQRKSDCKLDLFPTLAHAQSSALSPADCTWKLS